MLWEQETHAAVRKGDWKLVTLDATDDAAWELYDLSDVRNETKNVAHQHPELVVDLKTEWTAWAKQANVLAWPKERSNYSK